MIHELKTWPQYFDRIVDGSKTFEVRRNDRGFQAGDTLLLREYDPDRGDHDECDRAYCTTQRYTGRTAKFTIGFVLSTSPVADLRDLVVMSLLPASGVHAASPAGQAERGEQ